MNMNTHINRQAEEADGCWTVTFALLNISTEGKLSPGSAARGSGELSGDEDFYLSRYRWRTSDMSLISGYPTIMIAAANEWWENGSRAVEEQRNGDEPARTFC